MGKASSVSGPVCENLLGFSVRLGCVSKSISKFAVSLFLQRKRRIWLLDRLLVSVGRELRDDLGDWIKRKYNKGVLQQSKKAQKVLDICNYSVDELREQWKLQVEAQTSIRARECPYNVSSHLLNMIQYQMRHNVLKSRLIRCSPCSPKFTLWRPPLKVSRRF
jgi:hypothetical protein